jgi:5'-methylthioadenosine phosphorylase
MAAPTAEIGIFGGSGFYAFLHDVEEVAVDTPYGAPSAPVTIGEVAGKRVAFLPRHGRQHELPPHRINFRANLWALRELGVRRVIGPCACGALRTDLARGDFVVCDQYVDRTSGRADTFYDGPEVFHVSAAEPYCADLRRILVETARELGIPVHERGTAVVVQGPRFSTVAESRWFASMGWDVVNMTQYPEVHLARELELCYAGVAMVTDYDVGVDGAGAVSSSMVARVFADNLERLRRLLLAAVPKIGPQPDDLCAAALAEARI